MVNREGVTGNGGPSGVRPMPTTTMTTNSGRTPALGMSGPASSAFASNKSSGSTSSPSNKNNLHHNINTNRKKATTTTTSTTKTANRHQPTNKAQQQPSPPPPPPVENVPSLSPQRTASKATTTREHNNRSNGNTGRSSSINPSMAPSSPAKSSSLRLQSSSLLKHIGNNGNKNNGGGGGGSSKSTGRGATSSILHANSMFPSSSITASMFPSSMVETTTKNQQVASNTMMINQQTTTAQKNKTKKKSPPKGNNKANNKNNTSFAAVGVSSSSSSSSSTVASSAVVHDEDGEYDINEDQREEKNVGGPEPAGAIPSSIDELLEESVSEAPSSSVVPSSSIEEQWTLLRPHFRKRHNMVESSLSSPSSSFSQQDYGGMGTTTASSAAPASAAQQASSSPPTTAAGGESGGAEGLSSPSSTSDPNNNSNVSKKSPSKTFPTSTFYSRLYRLERFKQMRGSGAAAGTVTTTPADNAASTTTPKNDNNDNSKKIKNSLTVGQRSPSKADNGKRGGVSGGGAANDIAGGGGSSATSGITTSNIMKQLSSTSSSRLTPFPAHRQQQQQPNENVNINAPVGSPLRRRRPRLQQLQTQQTPLSPSSSMPSSYNANPTFGVHQQQTSKEITAKSSSVSLSTVEQQKQQQMGNGATMDQQSKSISSPTRLSSAAASRTVAATTSPSSPSKRRNGNAGTSTTLISPRFIKATTAILRGPTPPRTLQSSNRYDTGTTPIANNNVGAEAAISPSLATMMLLSSHSQQHLQQRPSRNDATASITAKDQRSSNSTAAPVDKTSEKRPTIMTNAPSNGTSGNSVVQRIESKASRPSPIIPLPPLPLSHKQQQHLASASLVLHDDTPRMSNRAGDNSIDASTTLGLNNNNEKMTAHIGCSNRHDRKEGTDWSVASSVRGAFQKVKKIASPYLTRSPAASSTEDSTCDQEKDGSSNDPSQEQRQKSHQMAEEKKEDDATVSSTVNHPNVKSLHREATFSFDTVGRPTPAPLIDKSEVGTPPTSGDIKKPIPKPNVAPMMAAAQPLVVNQSSAWDIASVSGASYGLRPPSVSSSTTGMANTCGGGGLGGTSSPVSLSSPVKTPTAVLERYMTPMMRMRNAEAQEAMYITEEEASSSVDDADDSDKQDEKHQEPQTDDDEYEHEKSEEEVKVAKQRKWKENKRQAERKREEERRALEGEYDDDTDDRENERQNKKASKEKNKKIKKYNLIGDNSGGHVRQNDYRGRKGSSEERRNREDVGEEYNLLRHSADENVFCNDPLSVFFGQFFNENAQNNHSQQCGRLNGAFGDFADDSSSGSEETIVTDEERTNGNESDNVGSKCVVDLGVVDDDDGTKDDTATDEDPTDTEQLTDDDMRQRSTTSATTASTDPDKIGINTKNFVRAFIAGARRRGFVLYVHSANRKEAPSKPVTVFLMPGKQLYSGGYAAPNLVWQGNGTSNPIYINLFEIKSVEKANAHQLKKFPAAPRGRTVIITTNRDKDYAFETQTEDAATRLLEGMRWVVARLAFNLVLGDLSACVELLDVGSDGGEDDDDDDDDDHTPSLPSVPIPATPEQAADWNAAMNDVTNHLVDQSAIFLL